jgi:hypothetical protein
MMAARLVLMAVLCLGTSGCLFSHKSGPKVAAPVPAVQPGTAQPATPPPSTPAEPAPPTAVQSEPAVAPTPAPKDNPPPKPAVRRNPVPAPPAAVAQPVPPIAPVAPAPPLREIISSQQRRQYEAEFSQGVARAGDALKQASTRTLNASQQETASRIRTFLQQANAVRDDDISTALQLARRADLLGQELLKSLK